VANAIVAAGGPGFYPQPNEWTCGPFALKHALVALGRTVHANEIAKTARTHWWSGTNEIRLARAARSFECDLVLERSRDAERRARCSPSCSATIRRRCCCASTAGRTGSPWCASRATGSSSIDSQHDPLLSIHTWAQLRNCVALRRRRLRDRSPAGPLRPDGRVQPRFRTHGEGRLLRRAHQVPAPSREPPPRAATGTSTSKICSRSASRRRCGSPSRCRWASSCAATRSCSSRASSTGTATSAATRSTGSCATSASCPRPTAS
jgi:hypothetical protein